MAILEIDCPVCAEVLHLDEQDRLKLDVGDVIACDSCSAEMEVTCNKSNEDFELMLLGAITTCPACAEEFDVTEEMLESAPMIESADGQTVSLVDCPHCQARIELEMEE